jgi:hypothetical protein
LFFHHTGDSMTHIEPLYAVAAAECCVCGHPLSLRALEEFSCMTDDSLSADIHCPSCARGELTLCHECSCRYTADPAGICGECVAREYSLAV